jgi:uncharacterized membrane protein (DUF2068 family)
MIAHPHWTKLVVLLINICVVLYILRILTESRRERCADQRARGVDSPDC